MNDRLCYVYMISNDTNTTLYTGFTRDIARRIWDHKESRGSDFAKKYDAHRLVYYEVHYVMDEAIKREKKLKDWHRAWKERLINSMNPGWVDLYNTLV